MSATVHRIKDYPTLVAYAEARTQQRHMLALTYWRARRRTLTRVEREKIVATMHVSIDAIGWFDGNIEVPGGADLLDEDDAASMAYMILCGEPDFQRYVQEFEEAGRRALG